MNITLAGSLIAQNSVLAKTIIDKYDMGEEGRAAFTKSRKQFEETLDKFADQLDEFLDILNESILRKEEDLKLVTFAYPNTEERGLPLKVEDESGLILTEAIWQTRYRDNDSGAEFKFTGVDPQSEIGKSPEVKPGITAPWPGAAAFETAYAEAEFKFIDIKTGAAVDRAGGTKYKEEIPKITPVSLTKYLINSENIRPGSYKQ
jgi:hypothetical protein